MEFISWSLVFFGFVSSKLLISTGKISNSACFGDPSTNATTMYLRCDTDGVIKIANVTAGAKMTSSGCLGSFTDASNISCCSASSTPGENCEFQIILNETHYEATCNGESSCEPKAGNEDTSGHCTTDFKKFSLYMYITYSCESPAESNSSTFSESPADSNSTTCSDCEGFPGWGIALSTVGSVGVVGSAVTGSYFVFTRLIKRRGK